MRFFSVRISKPGWSLELLFLTIIHLASHQSVGQEFDYSNVILYHFTVNDGLSQSNIHHILEDRDGLIWITTDDGLNQFDGNHFQVYKHNKTDITTISGNLLSKILQDSNGMIWVGSDQTGLNKYDKQYKTFNRYVHDPNNQNTISFNSIENIVEDVNQKLWVSSAWGLNRIDPKTDSISRFYEGSGDEGILKNECYSLHTQGVHIYVGHSTELSIGDINTRKFKHYKNVPGQVNSISQGRVTSILKDSKGRVWIGTVTGLNLFDEELETFTRFTHDEQNEQSLSHNIVNEIHESWNGKIWFGTESGISIYDENGGFYQLKSKNVTGFTQTSVYDIHETKDKVWIGSFGEGMYVLNKRKEAFLHYENFHKDFVGQGKNSVLEIVEDKAGIIWIGTDGSGLYRFDPERNIFKSYIHDPMDPSTISSNVIKSIFIDDNGDIYLGTYAGGMNIIDAKSGKIQKFLAKDEPKSLSSNHVWTIHKDHKERIWVGTLAGLNQYDPATGNFKRFPSSFNDTTHYSSEATLRILNDNQNNVWFATANGLNRYVEETETFIRYNTKNSNLPGNFIRNLYLSNDGTLWAVTSVGISCYDEKNDAFITLPIEPKIASSIQAVLEDDEGYLWLSTYRGIYRANLSNNQYRQFDRGDGVQGKEFNYDATLRASDGSYYFGGLNGFNVFKPSEVPQEINGPDVMLKGLSLFHEPVDVRDDTRILEKDINYQRDLYLEPQQNNLSITYTALDYNFPKRNNYSYILEGLDKNWNHVGEVTVARYTNLPPGDYVFKVKAQNKDGYWSSVPKEINLHIRTPFHQTNLARLLFVILVLGLIIAIFRMRTRTIRYRQELLKKHVRERTIELRREVEVRRNTEKELTDTLEKLKNTQNQLVMSEKMASIGIFTAGISHEINNPLNFIAGGLNLLETKIDPKTRELSIKEVEILNKEKDNSLGLAFKLIEEGFQRSKLIVRSLNNLFRKEEPTLVKTDVGELIKLVIEDADSLDVDIITSFKLPPVKVYPERLQQAIVNIVENAIHSTTQGSNPYRPRLEVLTYERENGKSEAVIEVFNSGTHIPEDIRHRIFDPFYTTKDPGIGTGLGLSMSYSFVKEHAGSITTKNKEEGVSFIIAFPIE